MSKLSVHCEVEWNIFQSLWASSHSESKTDSLYLQVYKNQLDSYLYPGPRMCPWIFNIFSLLRLFKVLSPHTLFVHDHSAKAASRIKRKWVFLLLLITLTLCPLPPSPSGGNLSNFGDRNWVEIDWIDISLATNPRGVLKSWIVNHSRKCPVKCNFISPNN